VLVKFDGYYRLQVAGNLVAEGTPKNMIVFTSNLADPSRGAWEGVEFLSLRFAEEKSKIQHCRIECAQTALRYPSREFQILHNVFVHNQMGLNIFVVVTGYHYTPGPVYVEYNLFADNEGEGLRYGTHLVPLYISYNTITNNGVGIEVLLGGEDSVVHHNNIHSNSRYDFRSCGDYEDIDAKHNWWGTTDISLIDQHIYDYYDDLTLSKVIYEPFATGPIPGTP